MLFVGSLMECNVLQIMFTIIECGVTYNIEVVVRSLLNICYYGVWYVIFIEPHINQII